MCELQRSRLAECTDLSDPKVACAESGNQIGSFFHGQGEAGQTCCPCCEWCVARPEAYSVSLEFFDERNVLGVGPAPLTAGAPGPAEF